MVKGYEFVKYIINEEIGLGIIVKEAEFNNIEEMKETNLRIKRDADLRGAKIIDTEGNILYDAKEEKIQMNKAM